MLDDSKTEQRIYRGREWVPKTEARITTSPNGFMQRRDQEYDFDQLGENSPDEADQCCGGA